MSAERRERYAAAMHSKRTGDLGTPWDRLSPDLRALWLLRADAAMAVADEELDAVNADFLEAGNLRTDNARLRAELDHILSRRHDAMTSMARRLSAAESTIARVRSVLDDFGRAGDAYSGITAQLRAALEGEQ